MGYLPFPIPGVGNTQSCAPHALTQADGRERHRGGELQAALTLERSRRLRDVAHFQVSRRNPQSIAARMCSGSIPDSRSVGLLSIAEWVR